MKIYKNIYLGLGVLTALALSSCQADMDEPALDSPVPTVEANTTIAELKAAMWKDDTNYANRVGYKDEANKVPYIIKGRVISSDASGNIYKSMYIQDETGAITLSINQASLYNRFPFGQEIVLNLSPVDFAYPDYDEGGATKDAQMNFFMGKYAGLEQIGGLGVYNGSQQVSFMNFALFEQGAQLSGNPVTNVDYVNFGDAYPTSGNPYCIRATIADITGCTSADDIRKMQSQFVELQNVSFQDGGKEPFAPYQETVSRNLTDASGNIIVVRNSGYASFYNDTLPEGTGNVRGLLSYFNGTWQLLLRSKADCIFSSKGTQAEPYTPQEVQDLANTGASGWVKGYIVGSLKSLTQTVSSNDDIDWGTADPTDNNLIIGPTADCKDFRECVILPLAQGSPARTSGNLLDNPGNLGKEISAWGTFATVSGMVGLSGNNGTSSQVEIKGVTLGGGGGTVTPGTSTIYTGLGESDATCDWTFDNVTMPEGASYIWQWKEYNSKHYLNASAYVGGQNLASLAWAVSPEIDLTGVTSPSVSFDHAAKFQTTLKELCGFGVRVAGTTEWTEIAIPTWPATGAWTFVNSGNIDLSAYAGKKIQIAFKYASSTAGADTWEIKNVKLVGNK